MPSQAAEACAPDGGSLPKSAKLMEVTRDDFNPCLESPDRFSESANLMVNIGLRLQRRRVQLYVTGANRVNVHSIHTSLNQWKRSTANFDHSGRQGTHTIAASWLVPWGVRVSGHGVGCKPGEGTIPS